MFAILFFIVVYMLSWRAKNRVMIAWAVTTGLHFVIAILLGDKDLVGFTVVFLLLPLVVFISLRKSREDLAHEDSEPIKTSLNAATTCDDGPGFYLNWVDAASHGAMFSMNVNGEDGPGYYL